MALLHPYDEAVEVGSKVGFPVKPARQTAGYCGRGARLRQTGMDETRSGWKTDRVVFPPDRPKEIGGVRLTNGEIAERTGLWKRSVIRIFQGHRKASVETIKKLAEAFEVSPEFMVEVLSRIRPKKGVEPGFEGRCHERAKATRMGQKRSSLVVARERRGAGRKVVVEVKPLEG